MLLALDVRNTDSVLGIYREKELIDHLRVESVATRTADEYLVLIHALLHARGLARASITAAVMSSVVPALADTFSQVVQRGFSVQPVVLGPGVRTGLPILCDQPREVGSDRIANAIAAFERVRSAVIVVDFGAATTMDVVNAKGEYLGGVIAPGIRLSADALFEHAARLPRVELVKPPRVLGRNTLHSLQSGVVLGHACMVDGMAAKLRDEANLPSDVPVFATGTHVRLVAPLTRVVQHIDEFLTLDGLRLVYERHVASAR